MPKVRTPLIYKQDNRTYLNSKDELVRNVFFETSNEPKIIKRPGFYKIKTVTTTETGVRAFSWNANAFSYLELISDTLYMVSSDLTIVSDLSRKTISSITSDGAGLVTVTTSTNHGYTTGQRINMSGITPSGWNGVNSVTVTGVTTFTFPSAILSTTGTGANKRSSFITSTSGKAYFSLFETATETVTMLHVPYAGAENSQLFKIDHNGVVTIITTNWPIYAGGNIVSFDGYLFGLNVNYPSAVATYPTIVNTNLLDPVTISALSTINANSYTGLGISLERHKNYIVCLKKQSIEYFYNAGNPTGSPLSPVKNANIGIGCFCASSVVNTGDQLIFIATDKNNGLGVHLLEGGVTTHISTNYIDRILSYSQMSLESISNATFLSFEGHRFYILNLEGSIKRTLVYDISSGLWSEWSSNDGAGNQVAFFANTAVIGSTNTVVVDKTTGDLYELSPPPIGSANPTTYKDGTNLIRVELITNNLDGGTADRKTMGSFRLVGDKSASSYNVSVQYSDDDYQTFSTARNIDTSRYDPLYRLGMFRRRAFKLVHEVDAPLRLSEFEIDVQRNG